MGSYITTGIIFDGIETTSIKRKITDLIIYLSNRSECYKSVKASKDIEGNEWIEFKFEELDNVREAYEFVSEGYFGQIDLMTSRFTSNEILVSVRVEKEVDYFGILLDIAEDDFLKSSESVILNAKDNLIIKFLEELYEVLEFKYAFCDNEAEIKFSPNEIQHLNREVYSILLIPSDSKLNGKINVVKSNWYLNGLTSRDVVK